MDFGPVAQQQLENISWQGEPIRVPPLALQRSVNARRGRSDRVEAIDAYMNAIQYLPNDPAAYYRLGKLYLKLNRKTEASQVLEQFLEIAPKGPYEEEVKEILRTIQKK